VRLARGGVSGQARAGTARGVGVALDSSGDPKLLPPRFSASHRPFCAPEPPRASILPPWHIYRLFCVNAVSAASHHDQLGVGALLQALALEVLGQACSATPQRTRSLRGRLRCAPSAS
jgi:hypothetical protein